MSSLSHVQRALVLAALALGPVGPAPASTQEGGAEAEGRRERRVLVLEDGRALRGPCLLEHGVWRLDLDGRLIEFPAAAVARARSERELLAELAKKRRALRPQGSDDERLEVARWALDNGLYAETLTTLDNALRRDVDDARAHELLARVPIAFEFPGAGGLPPEEWNAEQLTANVRFAVDSLRPVVLEQLALRILSRAEHTRLRAVLLAELGRPEERRRAAAAVLLRRTLSPGELLGDPERPADATNGVEIRALLRRAALDVADNVRDAAARTLRHAGHEGLAQPLVRALESRSPRVAMHAAEALGTLGHAAAVEPLVQVFATIGSQAKGGGGIAPRATVSIGSQVAYVSDYDVEIAQGASIADPKINVIADGVVLTASSLGISGYSVRRHTLSLDASLRRLTGASPGASARAWRGWWEGESGAAWRAARSTEQAAGR